MASSIQFRDSEAVLAAYLNRNCPAWGLFQGKQFMFKYEGSTVQEGEAALTEVLDMLGNGSTNAIYTLKVYEDFSGKKIKENTPCDGSFNFRLNDENQVITNSQASSFKKQDLILEKLAVLEARMDSENEEEEEEDETEKALGKIGSYINHPVVAMIAQALFPGTKLPALAPAAPGQTLGNVPAAATPDQQIEQALEILKQRDPKLHEHLGKLAAMAVHQPANFEFLIKTLDTL